MDKKIYDIVYKIEDTYWWFVGQRFLLNEYLKKYYNSKKNLKLLDVGCGTGINLNLLNKYGKAHGIDMSDEALRFCKIRKIRNVKKSNVMDIKFNSNSFDVVTSLGVFYHRNVTNDVKGLKEIYRLLKPSGRFFLMDPAMKCLFGKHDIAFHGIRRYSKEELQSKLEKVGFVVEKISYFNTFLFPFVYLKRKVEKLSKSEPKSEVQETINPLINSILEGLFKIEIKGLDYVNYPFGINIFAVAKKK